jgi:hypothetical protein
VSADGTIGVPASVRATPSVNPPVVSTWSGTTTRHGHGVSPGTACMTREE